MYAVIKCCKECVAPKRHPGCHGTCEEYLAERAEYEKQKEIYEQSRRVRNELYNQRAIRVSKALRRHGRKLL